MWRDRCCDAVVTGQYPSGESAGHPFRDLGFVRLPPEESLRRSHAFLEAMSTRRSVRHFSSESIPRQAVENALRVAASAPSGAHLQPWTFVVVEDDATKQKLRAAAEAEEREFYAQRATPEWLAALAPLGTDDIKEHLTTAPCVIVMFRHRWEPLLGGARRKNYYSAESCGIAAGFLIAALHHAGLATLPHTPAPMGFLAELLHRPANEQAFLVLPVGYPRPDARVPDIQRRPLEDVMVWHQPE